eukprot:scpid85969/ scgid7550/ 
MVSNTPGSIRPLAASRSTSRLKSVLCLLAVVLCSALLFNDVSTQWRDPPPADKAAHGIRRAMLERPAEQRMFARQNGNIRNTLGIVRLWQVWKERRAAFWKSAVDVNQQDPNEAASLALQALVPTVSCMMSRYGSLGHQAQVLCNMQQFTSEPCLVHSVGVPNMCTTALEIHRDFPRCHFYLERPPRDQLDRCHDKHFVHYVLDKPARYLWPAGSVATVGDQLRWLAKDERMVSVLLLDMADATYEALLGSVKSDTVDVAIHNLPPVHILVLQLHDLTEPSTRGKLQQLVDWLEARGLSVYYAERDPRRPHEQAQVAFVNRTSLTEY